MKSARSRAILAMAAFGLLATAVYCAAFPMFGSTTRSFSIDGARYSLIPSAESDFSLVRKELARQGIDLPPQSEEDPPPPPALSFAIASRGTDDSPRRLPLPSSFDIEHAVRLANEGGEVEMIFGTVRQPVRESVSLLRARGWSFAGASGRTRNGTVATYVHGKEKILAFLEAEGRGWLLVRRVVR